MKQKLREMRRQATRLRRTADKAVRCHDRAFFKRQAQRLDHQALELERRLPKRRPQRAGQ